MADSTNAAASAGSGIEAAAEAFQDILTPERKRRDPDEVREAQQGEKPTGKKAAAPEPEDDSPEDQPVDDEGDGEGEGDDEPKAKGDEPEEEEGDEPDSESDKDVDAEDDVDLTQTYTVTNQDGTEDEVTVEELVKGYFRQKDYTRKTQATAEERRVVATERAEVAAMRDQYSRGLTQLHAAISQAMPQEPDWEALKASDPIRYSEEWTDWQRRQHALRQIEGEQRQVVEQQRQEFEAERAKAVKAGRQWLLSQVPEWKDDAKRKADHASIKAYAAKVGFSPEELKNVDDPRAVLILRQAMLYQRLQDKKPTLVKVKPKAPVSAGTNTPVMKPKAAQPPQLAKHRTQMDASKRHAKEKSVDSAAQYFQTLLD